MYTFYRKKVVWFFVILLLISAIFINLIIKHFLLMCLSDLLVASIKYESIFRSVCFYLILNVIFEKNESKCYKNLLLGKKMFKNWDLPVKKCFFFV